MLAMLEFRCEARRGLSDALIGGHMKSFVIALLVVTVGGFGSRDSTAIRTDTQDACAVVQEAYKEFQSLKPGMTRTEVERAWRPDGGTSAMGYDRYVFRHCDYIKIKIDFKLVGKGETPGDLVEKVSTPYIEPSFPG
jgi:hypothetical protein